MYNVQPGIRNSNDDCTMYNLEYVTVMMSVQCTTWNNEKTTSQTKKTEERKEKQVISQTSKQLDEGIIY